MVRGNERKNIFLDEDDKVRYIETLSKLSGHALYNTERKQRECSSLPMKRDNKFYVYAYCLMDNHAHLLINEGEDIISRIMKRIGTSYAYYFNKKYGRVGHLFQDRFKSEAIEDEGYLLAVVRYIHDNPVKAGIVQKASSYQWSSYNGYLDQENQQDFIAKDMVLEILSKDRKRAIELFNDYTEQKNMDEFLDHEEICGEKTITGQREASVFVQNFFNDKGINLSDLNHKEYIAVRNELISQLKICSNLSIREIADLLKLNRGVVQRIRT
jgi:REP element-mobilizing transposase RayT